MYRLSQDVIVKQRGGIYFGLNMKTGTTYEMNESQFDIVSFFKNDYHSKDELLTYLTSIYDVTSKEIEAEVDFTRRVFHAGMVEQRPGRLHRSSHQQHPQAGHRLDFRRGVLRHADRSTRRGRPEVF